MSIYSFEQYPGDGVTDTFNVPFEYLMKDHIVVSVDGEPVPYTWVNDFTVRPDSVPPAGAVVEVRRVTPVDERVTDFQDGSTLEERDLDKQTSQLLYIVQEAYDTMTGTIRQASDGTMDARGLPISNVGEPTEDDHAATKGYVDTGVLVHVQAAQVARQGAEAARDQAQTLNTDTAATAATRLTEAQQARDDARTARAGSEAARDQAQAFAQQTAANAQAVADGLAYVDSKQLHVDQLVDAGDVVTKNVGTAPGNVPVVQEDGKLAPAILPEIDLTSRVNKTGDTMTGPLTGTTFTSGGTNAANTGFKVASGADIGSLFAAAANGFTGASGGGSAYGQIPYISSVSLSKSGTTAVLSVGTACNCNCNCNCDGG